MKKRIQTAVLVAAAALALTACGEGGAAKGGKADSAAESAVSEAADTADEAASESVAEEMIDDEEAEYFAEDDYATESEKLSAHTMENPFGDDPEVSVWDGIELVEDTDGATYSNLSSYANNISLAYEILKDDGDAVDLLKKAIKSAATENMSYVDIKTESARHDDSAAWCMMSFSGKGSMPYVTMFSLKKLDDGTALKSEATWYLGTDMYGIDYTPEEKYITMVKEACGISAKGDEIALSEADTEPDITLHEYEVTDSRVGRKSFYVWDEEPYVMTSEEMYDDTYDDSFYDESMPEEIYDEDDYDIDVSEFSDSEEEYWAESDAEWVDSDFDWDAYWTESDAEWAESDAEWDYSDEAYEDEDDGFIAYCTTAARGVFVNSEMYLYTEDVNPDEIMDEYIDNLAFMGANELWRSDVKSSDNARWVSLRYGKEADEAYSGLTMVHAIVWDETAYTKMDIYYPTDASEERLNEYLNAYGIDLPEANTKVEQENVDYEMEDEIAYEDDVISGEEIVLDGDEEINAVG